MNTTDPTVDGFTGVLEYNTSLTTEEAHEAHKKAMRQTYKHAFGEEEAIKFFGKEEIEAVEEQPTDSDMTKRVGVDSEEIASAVGVNNRFVRRVRFTFGQADYHRTVLSLRDDEDDGRFEIPEELVSKQTA